MKLQEIVSFLEEIAPLRFQEDYDNSGLIYGHADLNITGAMVSLDCTEAVIQEAVENGFNLVISHHPIVFKGIKKFNTKNYVERAIVTAIKHDVAIYAIHTNLDKVLQNGVNQKIANTLDLQQINLLDPHPSPSLAHEYLIGSGAVGNLRTAMDSKEFLDYLKLKMNLNTIRHTKILPKKIQKVAVCGGAGSFLLDAAKKINSDVFISADFKYHEFFDANDEILVVDIGHYESEYFTIELLIELLSNKFPKFAARYTKVITNPVFYY